MRPNQLIVPAPRTKTLMPHGPAHSARSRIRRWLPRKTDLDTLTEDDIQEIVMTLNLTPRKCLAYRSPVEAFLGELGRTLEIKFA